MVDSRNNGSRDPGSVATGGAIPADRAALVAFFPVLARMASPESQVTFLRNVEAVVAEAGSVEDIPTIAARYEYRKRRLGHLTGASTKLFMLRRGAGLGLHATGDYVATPGKVDQFKSPWERRLAQAFDRLGIAWVYEPTRLPYSVGATDWRTYIPDFALRKLLDTFIEVKGPAGVSSADAWKMSMAARHNSWATFLLWDAGIVEYVEDCETADQVYGLVRKTRFMP